MSPALDALHEALRREVRGKKDPPRALVRITGTAKGWCAGAGLLVPHGSGVELPTLTLDHVDDAAAWTSLLDLIRGGAG